MTDEKLAREIALKAESHGGKAYYVGGYVRDRYLGLESKDIDIEVHGVETETLEEILSLFGEVKKQGVSFGVYRIKGWDMDISVPRTEINTDASHTGFSVHTDPFIGEKDAARRRDFTMNALMEDVLTGEVLDFFGGKDDLEDGIIRHIDSTTFVEDPLRVLRAAQFASRLGFSVSDETAKLCGTMNLSYLSKERVFEEMKKALLKADKPSVFFKTLRRINQLSPWFSELETVIGVPQNQLYHKEGDVWNHAMMCVDEAAKLRDKAEYPLGFMVSALCHDLGKALVLSKDGQGVYHSYGHEKEGLSCVDKFLSRLCEEKSLKNYVLNMTALHQEPLRKVEVSAGTKSTNKMFDKSVSPRDLLLLTEADSLGRIPSAYPEKQLLSERLSLFYETMNKPYVQGRDLVDAGLEPTKKFSEYLSFAHKLRLAGIEKDEALKETLAYAKRHKDKEIDR